MRILVGISGGVDSAFAAVKLKKDGHEVEGAVLRMHEHTEVSEAECVAQNIGIPLHTVDCSDAFDNIIRKNFVEEYLAGRTPNPCIICNERVKFRFLYEYAMKNGFDAIATGHYAKIVNVPTDAGERFAFRISSDNAKDQTYMLYRLPQEIMSRLILPLGDFCKSEVREMAAAEGLVAADRPDSQEICFLPEGKHPEYIESVAGKCPEGDFIDVSGNVIGRHKGVIRYTVGQRKGLGISLGERAFVTKIDPKNNTVTLSTTDFGVSRVKVLDAVFSGMEPPKTNCRVPLLVKLRYSARAIPCVAEFDGEGGITLEFSSPVKAAPGQSAVLYRDETVMFGGIISGEMS